MLRGTCAPKTEREAIFALAFLFLSLSCPGQDLAYPAHLAARGRILSTAARSAPLRQQAVRRAILPQGAAGVGEWPGGAALGERPPRSLTVARSFFFVLPLTPACHLFVVGALCRAVPATTWRNVST